MKKLALAALAAATLAATAGTASAQVYYSGPGFGVYVGERYHRDSWEMRRHWRGERRAYRMGNPCPRGHLGRDGYCYPNRW